MSSHHHHHKHRYEPADTPTRASYERFLQFERLMKTYSSTPSPRFNPTPLGLCAFALTLFVYSMYNAGATVPVDTPPIQIVMGLAFFYGGLIQLLAGLLEFRIGNNFAALAFCSYGGFWFGLASLYSYLFNFVSEVDDPTILNKALGVFFLAWAIFTAAMFISSLRTNIVLIAFFFFLTITFILLTAYKFEQDHRDIQRAAGAFGILTSAIGWYAAFASLLKRNENSYFSLPVYNLAPQSPVVIIDNSSTDYGTQKL
jgi:succinate-acetate transporter protein